MKYYNKKTKQTVEAEDNETTKIAILERRGFKVVEDDTPTIPPAGALEPSTNPQEGQEGTEGTETGKDTDQGQKSALRPASAGTEALEKPADENKPIETPKPLKKAK